MRRVVDTASAYSPPMPTSRKRTHDIRIRVADSEFREFQATADAEGLTVSAWLRRVGILASRAAPPSTESDTPPPVRAAATSEPRAATSPTPPDPRLVELAAIEARLAELRAEPDPAPSSVTHARRKGVIASGQPRDATSRGVTAAIHPNADELGAAITIARDGKISHYDLAARVSDWIATQPHAHPDNVGVSLDAWRKRMSRLERGAASGRCKKPGDNWHPSPPVLREILAALAAVLDAPELRPEHWRGKVL